MLNFTLNLRHTVHGLARSSGERQGGGCGASVRDRCDKSFVETISADLAIASSIIV